MRVTMIDGLPVFDAKRPVVLHVTKGDIADADRKRPNACAVARSCYRELKAKEVRVHLGRVYVRSNEQNWQRFMTPKSMRSEIIAFDRGGKFEPGDFTLSAPQPSARASGKRQGSNKDKRKAASKPKRRAPAVVKNVRLGPA